MLYILLQNKKIDLLYVCHHNAGMLPTFYILRKVYCHREVYFCYRIRKVNTCIRSEQIHWLFIYLTKLSI